jgi:hypothetical protein
MTTIINRQDINNDYQFNWQQRTANPKFIANRHPTIDFMEHVALPGFCIFSGVIGLQALEFLTAKPLMVAGYAAAYSSAVFEAPLFLATAAVAGLVAYAFFKAYQYIADKKEVNSAMEMVKDIREGKIHLDKLNNYVDESALINKTDLDELLFKSEVSKLSYAEFVERYGSRGISLLTQKRNEELMLKMHVESENRFSTDAPENKN